MSLHLKNGHDKTTFFKIKTTAPKRYCVRPNAGKIEPGASVDVASMWRIVRLHLLNHREIASAPTLPLPPMHFTMGRSRLARVFSQPRGILTRKRNEVGSVSGATGSVLGISLHSMRYEGGERRERREDREREGVGGRG